MGGLDVEAVGLQVEGVSAQKLQLGPFLLPRRRDDVSLAPGTFHSKVKRFVGQWPRVLDS